MRDLVIGITLAIIAIGWVIASIPRGGKKAWFVGKPFLEPTLPVVMIVAFAVGLILCSQPSNYN